MKKKILLIILSIISVLACTLGFAACSKEETPGTSEDPPTTHEHVMQEVQAKDATCAEEGNIHYFYCGDCQKYFEDEAGAHELNADSIKLSKTTDHVYGAYTKTAEGHTRTCSVCGTPESGSHSYVNGKCSVCDYEHQDHSFGGYTKDENGHSHTCTVCGKAESDSHIYSNGACSTCGYEHETHHFGSYTKTEDGHTHTCSVCGKAEGGGHEYANGKCSVCEYDHQNHSFDSYTTDEETHTHTCSVCHKTESDSHTYVNGKCSVCQYEHKSHTFGDYIKTEEGHTHTCSVCQKEEGDSHSYENGKCSVCEYEHQSHTFEAYTKTEDTHTHTCSVCHKSESDNHTYANGTCTVCEYEHQNHTFGQYSTSDEEHFHTCDVCHKVESGKHTYENGKCSVCDYAPEAHSFGPYQCTEEGHTRTCNDCEKVESGEHVYENGKCKICQYEHKNHVYGDYAKTEEGHNHTCTVCHKVESGTHEYENGKCTVCQYEHLNHSFGNYTSDASTHIHTCDVCGLAESGSHTYKEGRCTTCEYEHTDHKFGSYTSDDSTHSHTCDICQKVESSSHEYVNGTCSICRHEHVEHSFGAWTQQDASCTENGYKEHTCDVCHKTVREEITSTGHSFDEHGICGKCGDVRDFLAFKTLQADEDGTVYGKVSNVTEIFSFIDEVTAGKGVTFTVSTDLQGHDTIPTKTTTLEIGNNVFYLLATKEDRTQKLFTVTVRRRPIYRLDIEVTKGLFLGKENVTVEEDAPFWAPEGLEKVGYNLFGHLYGSLKEQIFLFPFTITLDYVKEDDWKELICIICSYEAKEYDVTLDATPGKLSESEQKVAFDSEYTLPIPHRAGYSFLGWYSEETPITDGQGKGLEVWKFDEAKHFTAKWQLNYYPLTVQRDESAGSVTGEGSFPYETPISLAATTNAGYTFVGWFEGDRKVCTSLTYEFTMPDGSLDLTAKWIKVTLEGTNGGSVGTLEDTYIAGQQVSVTATTQPGYTFVGWFRGEENVCTSLTYELTMPEETTTYTAKWIVCPVTVESSDESIGTVSSLPETTVLHESITLEATSTIRLGYEWLGWYEGDVRLEEDFTYTFALEETERKIVAKYRMRPEMEKFDFTSTLTTCVVSGIKDAGETEICVPDYVTEITFGAFSGCVRVERITLPFVGARADAGEDEDHFSYIFGREAPTYYSGLPSSLSEIVITGGTTLGQYAFQGVGGTSITLPDSIISIGSFAFQSSTAEIIWGEHPAITAIGEYTFDGYNGTRLKIPDSVTTIGSNAFSSSTAEIIWGENPAITEIGPGAFSGYDGTSITIPEGVISIWRSAFWLCTAEIIWGENPSITEIGERAFSSYEGASLKIPENVTSIGGYAFDGCTAEIIWGEHPAITEIGEWAFSHYKGASLKIPEGVTTIGSCAFSFCTAEIVWGEHPAITEIGPSAFSSYEGANLTIPEGVISIGDSAFSSCSGLEQIEVAAGNPKYRSEQNCLIETQSKTLILGCKNSVIPDGVTTIGSYAFSSCTAETITLPDSLTSIGEYAFRGCSAEIIWGEHPAITEIGERAFDGYDGTSITIPEGVTSIGSSAFSSCSAETITLPDSVMSIGSSAFFWCTAEIIWGENPSITEIGESAFSSYWGSTITIPSSVTSIGFWAFAACSNLETVYYDGSPEDRASLQIDEGGNSDLLGATWYYFSAENPTPEQWAENENWWYYDVDRRPVIWKKN